MSSGNHAADKPARPRSLYVLVIFQVLQSLLFAGLSIYRLLQNSWLLSVIPFSLREIFDDTPDILIYEATFLLVSLALFVLALFMLSRSYSAWLLSIFLQGGLLLYGLITYYQGEPRYDVMVSGVILVLQLNLKSIQNVFRASTEIPL